MHFWFYQVRTGIFSLSEKWLHDLNVLPFDEAVIITDVVVISSSKLFTPATLTILPPPG